MSSGETSDPVRTRLRDGIEGLRARQSVRRRPQRVVEAQTIEHRADVGRFLPVLGSADNIGRVVDHEPDGPNPVEVRLRVRPAAPTLGSLQSLRREGIPTNRLRSLSAQVLGEQRYHRFAQRTKVASQSLLTVPGIHSTRRLYSWRDRHRGETCVILGNGPSLNKTDWNLIENVFTFGLNRIYLAFDDMGFETSVLVSVNQLVIEQCRDELLELPLPKFFSWRAKDELPLAQDIVFLQSVRGPKFSTNPVLEGVWEGATVTYVAMQLAYWMGFKRVVLIGVDHYFETNGPAHETVVSEGSDPNHFHPEYFGEGFRWQLPDLETSEVAYRLARREFEVNGRDIVDATIGGALTVFPKMGLRDALLGRGPGR